MEKNKKISCFLAYSSSETMASLMAQLPMGKGEIVDQVFFLAAQSAAVEGIPEQAKVLQGTGLLASDMMLLMAKSTEVDYVLFYMKSSPLTLGYLHIYNVLIDALLHISAASFHLEELLIQSRNHP